MDLMHLHAMRVGNRGGEPMRWLMAFRIGLVTRASSNCPGSRNRYRSHFRGGFSEIKGMMQNGDKTMYKEVITCLKLFPQDIA